MSATWPRRSAQYEHGGETAKHVEACRDRSRDGGVGDPQETSRPSLPRGVRWRRGDIVGRVVCNRYLVEEVLFDASGAFACRAYHLALDRPVLLSWLETGGDAGAEPWLVETPAVLKSRYVLNTIEAGRSKEGSSFFVSEVPAAGRILPLGEELPRLGTKAIVAVGRQLAMALDVAHRAGVTHGALKLTDVFLTESGAGGQHVLVLGFGVAYALAVSSSQNSGIFSREQGQGQPVRPRMPEANGDVVALGAILRELSAAAARANATSQGARAAARNAVLQGLNLIVQSCLSGDPEQRRIPSAWEVARDLARLEVVTKSLLGDGASEPPPLVVHAPARRTPSGRPLPKVMIREGDER